MESRDKGPPLGELMRLAIDQARRGIDRGQSPFGCAIWCNGQVVAATHNTVWMTTDITAHAEINALRDACRETGQVHLSGAIVATTCEPCPMCTGGLHWADVAQVAYGATIDDANEAGFRELRIPAAKILTEGGSRVVLSGGVMAQECRELFQLWLQKQGPERAY